MFTLRFGTRLRPRLGTLGLCFTRSFFSRTGVGRSFAALTVELLIVEGALFG